MKLQSFHTSTLFLNYPYVVLKLLLTILTRLLHVQGRIHGWQPGAQDPGKKEISLYNDIFSSYMYPSKMHFMFWGTL